MSNKPICPKCKGTNLTKNVQMIKHYKNLYFPSSEEDPEGDHFLTTWEGTEYECEDCGHTQDYPEDHEER